MKSMLAVLAIVLLPLPVAADEASFVRIGSTGIVCVMAPCPSFGLTPADSAGGDRGPYVWAGDELPPIRASEADRALVAAAWADKSCLLVEGAYVDGVLWVDAVLRACD